MEHAGSQDSHQDIAGHHHGQHGHGIQHDKVKQEEAKRPQSLRNDIPGDDSVQQGNQYAQQ